MTSNAADNGTAATSNKSLPLTDKVLESLAIAKRGVDELLIESDFAQKLARSEQTGRLETRRVQARLGL